MLDTRIWLAAVGQWWGWGWFVRSSCMVVCNWGKRSSISDERSRNCFFASCLLWVTHTHTLILIERCDRQAQFVIVFEVYGRFLIIPQATASPTGTRVFLKTPLLKLSISWLQCSDRPPWRRPPKFLVQYRQCLTSLAYLTWSSHYSRHKAWFAMAWWTGIGVMLRLPICRRTISFLMGRFFTNSAWV